MMPGDVLGRVPTGGSVPIWAVLGLKAVELYLQRAPQPHIVCDRETELEREVAHCQGELAGALTCSAGSTERELALCQVQLDSATGKVNQKVGEDQSSKETEWNFDQVPLGPVYGAVVGAVLQRLLSCVASCCRRNGDGGAREVESPSPHQSIGDEEAGALEVPSPYGRRRRGGGVVV